MPAIVVIEDEALLGRQLARALESDGHEVRVATSGGEGLSAIQELEPDLVLLDLRLPDRSGLEVLAEIRESDSSLPVVLMTAYGSVRDAVEAMRLGAKDYLQKPLDLNELRLTVEQVLARERRERELAYHRERGRTAPSGVIGKDERLLQIFAQAERLRAADLPPAKRPTFLLTGETGTGKGIIARAIHELLGGGPFIEVNCTAIPATLVEAELFGHERGSFTGAGPSRAGLFEAAEGGTLFLDEIGHLELGPQAKFLKVLEDKRVRRLGSTRDRPINVHVIAATNRNLVEAVSKGEFREDLYHRLRVLSSEIPPLRERTEDISLLATHFCRELGTLYGGEERKLTHEAESLFRNYSWPGNVRELRNVIERAILLEPGHELGAQAFAGTLCPDATESRPVTFGLPEGGINLAELERDLIRQTLERTGGNRTRAAALLGLTRDTLRYRLEKFNLS